MKTILLTGVTGFIGSNLLEALLSHGFFVVGLKRTNSNLWRIKEFVGNTSLKLIDIDNYSFDSVFEGNKIDTVIHSAWCGVKADDRNSLVIQLENFDFSARLFNTAIKADISKIISLGSQAEYGHFEGRVDENYSCNPTDCYGITKVFTSKLLKVLSEQSNTQWLWIRLFSLFGPKEDENWLIPFAIKKMLNNEDLDLTLAEQKYDYLYIKDFAQIIIKCLDNDLGSGVFNLSSNTSIQLKEILLMLKDIIKSSSRLNFGAIPYRENQVMHMEGDSSKIISSLNYIPNINLNHLLEQTVNYYKNR